MFETHVGALEGEGSLAYLRPETAQGIFINFKNVLQIARRKPPFGIAQIGKSFRNEITPGNFLFRVREFEQMEMEFFVPPDEAESGTATGSSALCAGTSTTACARAACASASRPGGALALLARHERHRVPLPDRLVGARGHREPRRVRPDAAHAASGTKLEYVGEEASATRRR